MLIIILKGLNVYSNQSGSFADAEGIACIDGKIGNWYNQLIILLINSELTLNYCSGRAQFAVTT